MIRDSSRAGLTLFGYGNNRIEAEKKQSGSGTLRKSPDGSLSFAPGATFKACSTYVVCVRVKGTKLLTGDSGGPFLYWQSGAWQQIGLLSYGHSSFLQERYGWGYGFNAPLKDGRTIRDWIQQTAAIPLPPPNSIVRNPETGAAWLVGDDGYRRSIPTGGDYQCFTDQGTRVINMTQINIDTIPDRVGTTAVCTPVAATVTTDSYGLINLGSVSIAPDPSSLRTRMT